MSQQVVWQLYGGSPPENYERYLVPTMFGPTAADLIELAAPAPGERVLDVACGTGIVARIAAERVAPTGKVTGLDINPGMLAVARSILPPGPSVEWQEASAEHMPFPNGSFDLVLCQLGLQFFQDRSAGLREMHRVLVSGGRLALTVVPSIEHFPPFAVMTEVLGRYVGPKAAGFLQRVFSLSSTEELRGLLAGAGFRDVAVRTTTRTLRLPQPEQFLRQYLSGTPLAVSVREVDDTTRGAMASEFAERCEPYRDGDALPLWVETIVGTARR